MEGLAACCPVMMCIRCIIMVTVVSGSVQITPTSRVIDAGRSFTFKCTVSGEGPLVIFKYGSVNQCTIHRDGTIIRSESGTNCSRHGDDNTTYLMTTQHVKRVHDRKDWHCQVGAERSNNATLDVLYPHSVEVGPVAPCKGFTHTENETNVSLNCTVLSANPAPSTFQWYHNNQSLSEGQTLVIPTVTRSTEGLYRCVAYSDVGPPGEDTVTVNVHYPPIVQAPRQTLTVNKSRDLNITCTVDANPSVKSIVWTKKGVQTNAQLPETNGVLGLRNLTKNDTGTYICTATNTVTKCDNTTEDKRGMVEVKVEVQYEPTITSFDVSSKEDQNKIAVQENTNVTFLCQVDSLPGADITIWKDGEEKNNTQNDSSLAFVLGSVGCHDTGNYTCSAMNVLGEVESDTLELLVKCSPRLMNSNSKTINWAVELNETAEYSVTVIAYPKPVFTLIQNTTDLDFDISSVGDGHTTTGIVTVYSVQEEQYNSYKLLVKNTEGELGLNLFLRPKSEPEKPVNVQVYNVTARSLSLSWEKGFNGGAIQNFTVEYRKEDSHWITHPIMLSEEEVLHLDLKDLQLDTIYEIRLTAHNEYGPSPSAFVHVRTSSGRISHYIIMYGVPAAATVVVIAIAFIIIPIIVFLCKRERKKGQLDITGALSLQQMASFSLRNENSTPEDDGSLLHMNEYAVPQERNVQRPVSYELPIIHQTRDNGSTLPRNEYATLQGRHLQRPVYQTCGPKVNHGPLSDDSSFRRFGSVPEVSSDGYLLPRNQYATLQGRHLQRPIYQTCGGYWTSTNVYELPQKEVMRRPVSHEELRLNHNCGDSPSPRPVCGQKAFFSDVKRVDSAALDGVDCLMIRNKFEIPQEMSVMKPKPFKKLRYITR